MTKLLPRNFKGQTLVIILLGTSIALTLALAVSVRTVSTLKQTTTTAQAQEALAAAEAGAEVALAKLKTSTCGLYSCDASNIPVESSNPNSSLYSVKVTQGGGGADPYLLDLVKDQTQEIKLDGSSGSSVNLYWYNPDLDGTTEPDNALELIYFYAEAGVVKISKSAYNGKAGLPNGFPLSANNGDFQVSVSGKQVKFKHYVSISLTSVAKILRVKTLYNNISSALVTQPAGSLLPVQSYVIDSVGQSKDGRVKKAIRVTKSLPSLPSIFDFGLFSGSQTEPLAK